MARRKKTSLLTRMLKFIRERLQSSDKRVIVGLLALVIIIAIVVAVAISISKNQTSDTDEGVAYIKGLEQTDTTAIEEKVKELRRAERIKAMEAGDFDVWSMFTDTAILGDSRAVGFSYHEFVDENRVFAEGGATIRNIEQYTDQLVNLNPSSIIFCFGLNDVSIGFWDTPAEYIAEQDQIIEALQKALPNATIYVNSIIPAIDPAFELSEAWKAIPDWNQEIKKHCEEKGIAYIDITETVEEHKDLYDIDGIHMQKAFYDFWAIDIMTEVMEDE